jgi:hypothetical protein
MCLASQPYGRHHMTIPGKEIGREVREHGVEGHIRGLLGAFTPPIADWWHVVLRKGILREDRL